MAFHFSIKKSTKAFIDDWYTNYYPNQDGERDAEAFVLDNKFSGHTPNQYRYKKAFEQGIESICNHFIASEEAINKDYNQIKSGLLPVKKEYFRLRQKLGDRDPEILMNKTGLAIFLASFFIMASIVDAYLFTPIFQIIFFKIASGCLLGFFGTAIGYFGGRFQRHYGVRHINMVYTGIVFILYSCVIFLILDSWDFASEAVILGLCNYILLLLVLILTHLAYDVEPDYPQLFQKYRKLSDEITQLRCQHIENLNLCNQVQHELKAAAEQMDITYIEHFNKKSREKGILKPQSFEIKQLVLKNLDEIIHCQESSTDF
ncbi:hypothetical protein DO021_18865 [Desulfobacter hydrogenophilus]|uniref:MFS transporter n=1 Tax=Desulfobacter hydrogenophilus TaxID=2291 RepID=A0A328FBP4_9BACT|nr:hypothetical protein [Desulfobacter hydrogenophilus]NDY73830.1 hypothetical protein [Desulfobacter hydrogenophilus]QBH13159.1 hypothetical protein EYB58_09650 [Desulfobacter hydrogenophilus]RAM00447.1 hypothetical protein DO021_18865 [Desulfobacter hydrogenophilus]